MTIGPEAECLAKEAGAIVMYRLLVARGNGVVLGDDLVLSARHIIGDEGYAFAIEGVISTPQVIRAGPRGRDDHDWALVRVVLPGQAKRCRFEFADSVRPGQEALLVGYWSPTEDGEVFPIAFSGTVIETPRALQQAIGDRMCLDLGTPMSRKGLSGSPVLVKDPGSPTWKLAGVFSASVTSDRGDFVAVCARIPPELEAWVADGDR